MRLNGKHKLRGKEKSNHDGKKGIEKENFEVYEDHSAPGGEGKGLPGVGQSSPGAARAIKGDYGFLVGRHETSQHADEDTHRDHAVGRVFSMTLNDGRSGSS